MVEIEINTVYLEFVSQNQRSYKFYQISISCNTVTITYGKIGHVGTTKSKTFNDPEKAQKFFNHQVKQKTQYGYKEAIKGKRLPRLKPSHPNQLVLPFYV